MMMGLLSWQTQEQRSLTGRQWDNPFKASKTLSLPYDTMCRMWVMSGYSSAVAGVRS